MSGSGLVQRGVERFRGGGHLTVGDERVKPMQAPAQTGVLDLSAPS